MTKFSILLSGVILASGFHAYLSIRLPNSNPLDGNYDNESQGGARITEQKAPGEKQAGIYRRSAMPATLDQYESNFAPNIQEIMGLETFEETLEGIQKRSLRPALLSYYTQNFVPQRKVISKRQTPFVAEEAMEYEALKTEEAPENTQSAFGLLSTCVCYPMVEQLPQGFRGQKATPEQLAQMAKLSASQLAPKEASSGGVRAEVSSNAESKADASVQAPTYVKVYKDDTVDPETQVYN